MTGKDSLDVVHTLAGFVTSAYNIHLAIVTALVGLVSAAAGSKEFVLTCDIKIALIVFYMFVALSSIFAVEFLYQRINAMSEIARVLLKEELAGIGQFDRQICVLTEPVKGKIHRILFPILMVLVVVGILFAPA